MTLVEFMDKHIEAIGHGLLWLGGVVFVLILFHGWPWRRG